MRKAADGIVAKLRRCGYDAFFAGGWVRDFLLGRRAKDIDIATNALPETIQELFPSSRAIGAAFGVVQVWRYGHAFEVATFRCDHDYRDGRHPEKVTFSTAEVDASRRDFTINGLFYDPMAKRLIDYIGGHDDLRQKIIRAIGDASRRFAEDKLRMLRAIRFACELGFSIERETWNAVRHHSSDIFAVSRERIRDEFLKVITGPDPGRGLDLLLESGLLTRILPEIARSQNETVYTAARDTISSLSRPSPSLAMGALMYRFGTPVEIESICRRLKMSNEEIARTVDMVSSRDVFDNPDAVPKSTRIRMLRKPNPNDHLQLLRACLLADRQSLARYSRWRRELKAWRQSPPPLPLIDGDALIALGCKPGPIFREILQAVEDLQYEGVLTTRPEALRYVRSHYIENEDDGGYVHHPK